MIVSDNTGESGRSRSLQRALSNIDVTVIYCDPDLRVAWSENVPASWSKMPIAGKGMADFLPSAAFETIDLATRKAIATAQSQQFEISIPSAGGAFWFSVWVDCEKASNGELRGILKTAVDITEQKRREQTLRALLLEVAHRSKNLLAIIQSIATQTGRHSGTIENFLLRFRGRLQSLAATQDLVTSSNWRGAALHELVIGQLGRYVANPDKTLEMHGERPYLNPNAALHIGLALHELAVNSVSYGALSKPGGRVSLTTSLGMDGANHGLTLEWREKIRISDRDMGEKRFGSIALERVVPASLKGSASLELANDHLTYRLNIPPGNFELED